MNDLSCNGEGSEKGNIHTWYSSTARVQFMVYHRGRSAPLSRQPTQNWKKKKMRAAPGDSRRQHNFIYRQISLIYYPLSCRSRSRLSRISHPDITDLPRRLWPCGDASAGELSDKRKKCAHMCHVRIQFDGRDDAVWYDCQAKIVKHWSCLTSWYGVTALVTVTSQRSLVSTFPQAVTHGPRRPYSTMIRSS